MNRKYGFARVLTGVLLAFLMASSSTAAWASGDATGGKPAQGSPQCAVQQVESTPETIEKIMNSDDVAALTRFLMGKSLTAKKEGITASKLTCSDNSKGFEFFIIPFVQGDIGKATAHIAVWNGYWEGVPLAGAIGAFEDDPSQVFVIDKGTISSYSREAWFGKQPVRFDSFLGSPPRMIDATEIEGVNLLAGLIAQPPEATSTETCTETEGVQTGYTVLGFVAFRFHQRVSWCYTGSSYTISRIDTSISDVDLLEYYRGVVVQWDEPHDWYHVSFRQGMFENCVPVYGCLSASYPSVTVTVDQYGGHSYTTGW